MKKFYSRQLIIIFVLIILSACSTTAEPTEIFNTPTVTSTPKPKVECPQEEVDAYLDEIEYTLEEWDDTYLIATSTSRMSLAPIISELQKIKRDVSRIDRPECANYINDIISVAMESDVSALISFLSQDSDSVVSKKMAGAQKAWEIADAEFENFKEAPLDAYFAFNLTSEDITAELEQSEEFKLPEDWKNIALPATDLTVSIPDDWDTDTYGDNDEFISLSNTDGSITVYGGDISSDAISSIESDAGRLFSLQTYLETSGYDYYNEHSANMEVHYFNKAYVVEYSVREFSGNDIKDRIMAYIFTPDNSVILFICETSRDEFAQIDLIQIREIFGSIRK